MFDQGLTVRVCYLSEVDDAEGAKNHIAIETYVCVPARDNVSSIYSIRFITKDNHWYIHFIGV